MIPTAHRSCFIWLLPSLGTALLGGFAGARATADTPDWLQYTPPDGWERRIPPPAIILPPTMVSFQPTDPELQGRVFLDIRDVTEERYRMERIATYYMRARQGEGRHRQHEARRDGAPEPDYECEMVSPSMSVAGEVEAVYVRFDGTGNRQQRLVHFIHLSDGSRFRVDYTGSPPHFDEHRRAVMSSLRSLSFQPVPREETRPSRREKIAYLAEQLDSDGTRLWLYDGTVAGKRLSDDDLVVLEDPIFSQVSSLNLISGHNATLTGVEVGDTGLRHVTHLPLTFLCLRGSDITDAGLGYLADLPLTALVLSHTLVEGSGLRYLRSMPLTALELASTGVGDEDLRHLVGLPIGSLNLSYTWVTDAGMRWLADLPLVSLMLTGTDVTERGLEELGPTVDFVMVPRHIPEARLVAFRERHPGINATR